MLPDRLKELRKEKGVSQADIAEYLGISKAAYGFYEAGRNMPSVDILISIAEYFAVSTDYLLARTNARSIKSNHFVEAAQMKNDYDKLSSLPDDDKQMIEDLIELRYMKWLKDRELKKD